MNNKRNLLLYIPALLFVTATFLVGCGGEVQDLEDIPQDEKIIDESTNLFSVDDKIFYIPSPVQTSLLMKKIAAPYSKDLLNDVAKVGNYTTSFKQAVNIGVYGADLGYITANNKNQEAISHLSAVKKLSDELGVSSAFDFSELEKFGGNAGNEQEMLTIITHAYKSCEEFLRQDERHDVAGLIMAGALIESLYFAVNFVDAPDNQDVINRIGEQASTLDNIVLVLNPHYSKSENPELSTFVDKLVKLQGEFDRIKVSYSYQESTIDAANKLCTINSKSQISIKPAMVKSIANQIKAIRDLITS
ncbi:MAG: hypothetical protein COB85_06400 [Bacteroidetes bacterium]|nr:MAG: hypothetical protein COB85_06400 [Bacteroidota bacterium]